ncbi:MAG: hypothetical protein SFY81_14110 [Verrucomicrobiota bacterium]|nr:hypothetical protein [Verrucomicrobiota bacterium]
MEKSAAHLHSVSEKVRDGIRSGKFTLNELQMAAREKGKYAALRTDEYVHANAWTSIGIAAGVAFILGMMVPRGRHTPASHQPEERPVDGRDPLKTAVKFEFIHSLLPLAMFAVKSIQASRCARRK